MEISITICLVSLLALIWLLRMDRLSFGLPIAYLGLLLLNHVPGAYAHLVAKGRLGVDTFTEIGIGYTALGCAFFVVGVALARIGRSRPVQEQFAERRDFSQFFLVAGWIGAFLLSGLEQIPSLGAAVGKGSAIWMLAVLLGLRHAVSVGRWRLALLWAGALVVYPVVVAVTAGFLSYGTAAIFIVGSVLAVSVRRGWKVLISLPLVFVLVVTMFVNYFENRDNMRAAVWGGRSISERIDANLGMFTNFKMFDPNNPSQLNALDERLNQNIFIGIADTRLKSQQVEYLNGRSVEEAVLSLVPRALWPSKPVYGGSPAIVAQMTGLRLSQSTSFGVGQIMELHVNFGALGVALGMMALGWLLGFLDLRAAMAEARGDLSSAILFFLPAAALIQPIGSLVELSGGAAAALVAALGWRWVWRQSPGGRAEAAAGRDQPPARPPLRPIVRPARR